MWPLLAAALLAPVDLPVLAKSPAFGLTDQDGRKFVSSSLKGKVWVADFIFTSCTDVCPGMTRSLRRVQKALGKVGGFRYVSFSIDPARDTPSRLKAFALQHGADLSTWSFLTGSSESEMDRIARAFLVHSGHTADGKSGHAPVTHSQRFVLVDQRGQVRGAYRSDDEGVDRLVAGARQLLGTP
ncbi:MAG: SCO family protein [Candidatus Sericytochromatia bacterium]|nr:SCO family protein [Candidatus Sericytochromatia bacterium]